MTFSTPTADDDNRSGVNDDTILCPECEGNDDDCMYCDGLGVVSEREYKAEKAEEKDDREANEYCDEN